MPEIDLTRELIKKYDVAGPRYTSYPTAPVWKTLPSAEGYETKLKSFGRTERPLSIYIHIPFCESLCYFCACNKIIRKSLKTYGDQYIDYLAKEMELLCEFMGRKKPVIQLHWGGGTPTFLDEEQIKRLFNLTCEYFDIHPDGEISIEIDPRTTKKEKIRCLRELGFNRISMGVQDFHPEVQKDINRIQPYELVKEVYEACREYEFTSVNMDLIYGLPYQTQETFKETVERVIDLGPDRIALYSYANVPWLIKHQERMNRERIPDVDQKLDIFMQAREQFMAGGYLTIAMDHFAKKSDAMAEAFLDGTLWRNFMGYTLRPTDDFIGLGVSSIGFVGFAYFQNQKNLDQYYEDLDNGRFPIERGKILSDDDIKRQWVITSIMCRSGVDKREFENTFGESFDQYFSQEQRHLEKCEEDGLVEIGKEKIDVTPVGRIFIRNIAMGFDWYLRQKDSHKQFSKTV
ncbi:oxygen-independent coproporphyrinogen III oxidase [PVC group bacterium]|nr:oxygen-independent coproporphyrinogen III oxidase [PVC group bacterium]